MNSKDLQIKTDLTEEQIDELIRYSTTDQVIIQNTSDAQRFRDRMAVDIWLTREPSVYVLTNKANKLLGLVWARKAINPTGQLEFDTTAALRIYGKARGKGLSKWFFTEALKRYGPANWWIRAVSGGPAVRVYQSLGFQVATKADGENRVILVRHSAVNSVQ